MMAEINLLRNYPKSNRDLNARVVAKTEEVRKIARKFDFDYFDGDRKYGYGGFTYHPKYWTKVVKDFYKHYELCPTSSVLDVGCGKGFMLYDFKENFPELTVAGIDISNYALENAKEEVKQFLRLGSATELPYEDRSFDLVISINTIHNLNEMDCKKALQEIQRVAKVGAFVTVDAFSTDLERKRMFDWNLTALTIKSIDEWKSFFVNSGYKFDYYWFMP
jgi:ubiquinone/menaquinone biosynthesis C-methylase UbiE